MFVFSEFTFYLIAFTTEINKQAAVFISGG